MKLGVLISISSIIAVLLLLSVCAWVVANCWSTPANLHLVLCKLDVKLGDYVAVLVRIEVWGWRVRLRTKVCRYQ